MRDAFVKALTRLARQNRNIELLTGDIGFGALKPYYEAVPDQFMNVGIAEQNMAAMAAGMALEGKTVFIYSIGNFPTLRCLEQIRNDCAYPGANVKIVCVGGGFAYGPLGMSHHATEDIAIMRALPGVCVLCPGDPAEAEAAAMAMAAHPGTVYIRLGRGGEKRVHDSLKDFQIGKALSLREAANAKKNVALFSTGGILDDACAARSLLEEAGIGVAQYSFPTVKPLDVPSILRCAEKHRLIATIEEGNITGGFGGAVAETIADAGLSARLLRIGLMDQYCQKVGDQKYLREQYGLSGKQIAVRILEAMA